jgi:hypothetical protein
MQLRERKRDPFVAIRKERGTSHGVLIAAEEMLLRQELKAFPLPDTLNIEVVDDGYDGYVDQEVQQYFDAHFGDYVASFMVQGSEPQ